MKKTMNDNQRKHRRNGEGETIERKCIAKKERYPKL
jgi:hypothetical protein